MIFTSKATLPEGGEGEAARKPGKELGTNLDWEAARGAALHPRPLLG